MKKIISSLRSKVNNIGSSIVLVIVALAFIGILAGALLTAVGSVYRLKLYDYNAKDNFYYLEIAMNEVYAGVGNSTMDCLKEAYTDTIEDMVRYDATKKAYVTIDQAVAKTNFDTKYKTNLDTFATSLINGTYSVNIDGIGLKHYDIDEFLTSFISNADVKVEAGRARIITGTDTDDFLYKIKNVTLTRTSAYTRSNANGTFEQTISADIVMGSPDFDIRFDFVDKDASDVYDYAMISDSGIEILQDKSVTLNITGNIYAGNDFYNKAYNSSYAGSAIEQHRTTAFYDGAEDSNLVANVNSAYDKDGNVISGIPTLYSAEDTSNHISSQNVPSIPINSTTNTPFGYYNFNMAVVNSQIGTDTTGGTTSLSPLVNKYLVDKKGTSRTLPITWYNGTSVRSMYSGLYIDDADVNILASRIIVPGTIAVMNRASLNVYGLSTAGAANNTSLWADNIVLDNDDESDSAITKDNHPKAVFRADVHVRDDLEMNADYSEIYLKGNYYGFGNGTKKDNRIFTPFVNNDDFDLIEDGKVRSHYTTSSIVINGENSKLDLTDTNNLYIAGRAYVELSKDIKKDSITNKKYFEFDKNTNDFKTGESVSIKTNQRAYNTQYLGITVDTLNPKYRTDSDGNVVYKKDSSGNIMRDASNNPIPEHVYYEGTLDADFVSAVSSPLYQILAGGKDGADADNLIDTDANGVITNMNNTMTTVPCTRIDVGSGTNQKTYYYIDFDEIWYQNYLNSSTPLKLRLQYSYRNNATDTTDVVTIDTEGADPNIGTPHYDLIMKLKERVVLKNADDLSKYYITIYNSESTNYESPIKDKLTDLSDIIDYTDAEEDDQLFKYREGELQAENPVAMAGQKVYSSGALNAKEGTTFEIVADDDTTATMMARLKEFADSTSDVTAADVSDEFEKRYAYTKWSLVDYNKTDTHAKAEYNFVQDLCTKENSSGDVIWGESYITPINKYFNFNRITSTMFGTNEVNPTNFPLTSGYSVYISNGDVTIDTASSDGVFQGLVFAKGSVFFSDSVKKFDGMIVSGDKIFVYNDSKALNAISANPEVIKAIMAECETMDRNDTRKNTARKVLALVKAYEKYSYDDTIADVDDGSTQKIDTLKYTDVVKFENWMRNVQDN